MFMSRSELFTARSRARSGISPNDYKAKTYRLRARRLLWEMICSGDFLIKEITSRWASSISSHFSACFREESPACDAQAI